jgi:dihydroorotase-like cyclic amidohydrolase
MSVKIILISIFLFSTLVFATEHTSILLRNAEIIDVLDGHQTSADIIVENGLISKIAPHISRKDLPEINLEGAYVIPGLIDSHVHLKSVPGSVFRGDSEETYWKLFDQHLRAYVAAGVTTVLDAAAPKDLIERLATYKKLRKIMPEVLTLAPFLTPDRGYMTDS